MVAPRGVDGHPIEPAHETSGGPEMGPPLAGLAGLARGLAREGWLIDGAPRLPPKWTHDV
jgi:hypothetical protein